MEPMGHYDNGVKAQSTLWLWHF